MCFGIFDCILSSVNVIVNTPVYNCLTGHNNPIRETLKMIRDLTQKMFNNLFKFFFRKIW